jgi:Protein of unknown function (DUF3987)
MQPPFPTKLLPPLWRTFVEDIADRKQVPADFAAIPALVMAATVIGNESRLQPMKHDDWKERPCLWAMVVAHTGAMKSPVMEETLGPLKRHEQKLKAQWKARHAAWKALPENKRQQEPEPIRQRYLTNNATTEVLLRLMTPEGNGRPGHLLYYCDELPAFFAGLDRYTAKKDGGDRAFVLTCNTGGPYNADRITQEQRSADDCYLSVLGGVQPGKVPNLFRDGEVDGLTARYGLAVKPRLPERALWVDKQPDYAVRVRIEKWVEDMREVKPAVYRLDGLAYAIASRWLESTRNRADAGRGTSIGAHLAKYPGLYVRLALVFHFMKHGAGAPTEVDSETATVVARLIDGYLEPHARHLYDVIEAHPALPGARKIAAWVRVKRMETFTIRDVRQNDWKEFAQKKDVEEITSALNLLEANGWLKMTERPSTVRGGRPTTQAVVNPKAFAGL